MDKYTAPFADVMQIDDPTNSSVPTPGENEGDIIPWANWANP